MDHVRPKKNKKLSAILMNTLRYYQEECIDVEGKKKLAALQSLKAGTLDGGERNQKNFGYNSTQSHTRRSS